MTADVEKAFAEQDRRDAFLTVDAITQLAMMLKWEEDYSDQYKCRVIIEAIRAVIEA